MSFKKSQHSDNKIKIRTIFDNIMPMFDGDLDFRLKFYAKKKTTIPKFASKTIDTNIIIRDVSSFNIYIKQKFPFMKTKGFLKQDFSGPLRVRVDNNSNVDISLGKRTQLGYILCLPFVMN